MAKSTPSSRLALGHEVGFWYVTLFDPNGVSCYFRIFAPCPVLVTRPLKPAMLLECGKLTTRSAAALVKGLRLFGGDLEDEE